MRWTLVVMVLGFFGLVAFIAWQRFEIKKLKLNKGEAVSKVLSVLVLVIVGASLQACGIEQVEEGSRGIYKRFGKIEGEPLPPGLHFYNPFTADIFEMEVREHKIEGETQCFTRDTQNVNIKYAVTYYPDPSKIGHLYSQFGREWDAKIIPQIVLGSIKDVVGQYIADDLVGKREAAKSAAQKELTEALSGRDVTVTRLDFVNLDFDDAYEKAVEAKVVAVQKAAEAKNKTVEVAEKANQTVLAAKADAEAMRIKSQALSQNKGLVQYEAIQKWDGKLPQYQFGGSVPIINLGELSKSQ